MPDTKPRFKITIRCKVCGEKFVLRGTPNGDGGYETGFKRCVCGNETKLNIDVVPD